MRAPDHLGAPAFQDADPPDCTCEHCLIWQSVIAAVRDIGQTVNAGGDWGAVVDSTSPKVREILRQYGVTLTPDH